jgi:DNA repair exonuclease SbcCD ATPase subunit
MSEHSMRQAEELFRERQEVNRLRAQVEELKREREEIEEALSPYPTVLVLQMARQDAESEARRLRETLAEVERRLVEYGYGGGRLCAFIDAALAPQEAEPHRQDYATSV